MKTAVECLKVVVISRAVAISQVVAIFRRVVVGHKNN